MNLHIVEHPLVADSLCMLRDASTQSDQFQRYCHTVSTVVLLEATRSLPVESIEIDTPLETIESTHIATQPVFIPVLRAGLGMLKVALDLFPGSSVGHLGIERDESTATASSYYSKLPDLTQKDLVLLDPMLATGGSAITALSLIKRHGTPNSITLACIVAAPEGVEALQSNHPDVPIVTAALDRELNDLKYILPGLGDFGDRYFNT